jgi:hypothetical protein
MKKAIGVQKIVILFSLLLFLLLPIQGNAIVSMPPQDTPPIISANHTETNCTIFNIDGELWANVDMEYQMKTIHTLGSSFSRPYEGDFKVVANTVNAHYPVPISAQNLSVKINNQEISWQYHDRRVCHIFDLDLPEINWTIGPVPKTFTVTVHFVQPIPKNSQNNSLPGQYALVLPLMPRFGSTDTPSFHLYSWYDFGTPSADISIEGLQDFSLLNAYLIARGSGSLSEVERYSINNTKEMQFQLQAQWDSTYAQQSFPFGAVVLISQTSPTSPPVINAENQNVLLLIVILAIAAVTLVTVLKMKKRVSKKRFAQDRAI